MPKYSGSRATAVLLISMQWKIHFFQSYWQHQIRGPGCPYLLFWNLGVSQVERTTWDCVHSHFPSPFCQYCLGHILQRPVRSLQHERSINLWTVLLIHHSWIFTVPRIVLLILCVQYFVTPEMLVYINGFWRVYCPLNVSVVWTDLYRISLCKLYVPPTAFWPRIIAVPSIARFTACVCVRDRQTDAMHKRKTHPMFICS